MKNLNYVFTLLVIFIISCVPSKDDQTSAIHGKSILDCIPPLNVIVALDLSNRIDAHKNPDQAAKDQMIIEAALHLFGERQKQFGYMISKDKFTVVSINQENPTIKGFEFIDKLSIDMQDKMNHPKYNDLEEGLINSCSMLYDQAATNAESGADIYTWFKNNLPTYLEQKNYINKIIILTDGYLAFDPQVMNKRPQGTKMDWSDINVLRSHPDNWENLYKTRGMQLKPHQIDLNNTEVRMMELNPKNFTHELDILKLYWKDWLDNMNVKQSNIYPQFTDRNQMANGLKKCITND